MTTKHDILPAHQYSIRVYYEDTDAGGVVYNANYLKFAERGRTEYLRELGYNQRDIAAEHQVLLMVRHIEIDFLAPGKLDDLLEVGTDIISVSNVSFTAKQAISRDATVLAEVKTVIVTVSPSGRPVRIPPQLRQIFGR